MLLYHGTRASALPSIRSSGLRPRGRRRGNWKHSVESNPRAVYLTCAYLLHFAASATSRGDLLIIEIEVDALDRSRMAPDEDFLEQVTRQGQFPQAGRTMEARTRWFRKRASTVFQNYWELSLERLGTCCYHGVIPAEALTRWAIIPPNHSLVRASDPAINLQNYCIMGGYYRQLVHLVFGDPIDDTDLGIMESRSMYLRQLSRDGVTISARGEHQ